MTMVTFTATEAKQNFGKLTDTAMIQPVTITRQGRVILEVMTPQEKERLIAERVREFAAQNLVQFLRERRQNSPESPQTPAELDEISRLVADEQADFYQEK